MKTQGSTMWKWVAGFGLALGLVWLAAPQAQAQTPNGFLDFGTTADGTAATVANTGFDGVRVGAGGGGFTIKNPGQSIGSDAELRGVAPTGASINSVGISNSYGTAALTFTASFELYLSGGDSGSWYFFAGQGASFSSNQTVGFTGAQVFTGLKWTFGASGAIAVSNRAGGAWSAAGITGTPFAQSNAYFVSIVGNNSAATVSYGASQSVAAYKYDLWVNGTLVGDELDKAQLGSGTNITAFRFYGENSAGNVATLAVDNIRWYNTCVLPPTHLAFVGAPGTGAVGVNLSSFTVEARSGSASGPVATAFVNTVTLAKATGSGAISGTLAPSAVAGVATYSDIQFNAADTYTMSASAASPIVGATSGNVVVSPAVKLSVTDVNVREAGEGRFFVKLGSAPVADVTVTVAHNSGDASLVVGTGGTLTFTAVNWNTAQSVVLTQAADGNTAIETAIFKVSASGVADQYVNATALDDDGIGENMALASSGSTITGSAGSSYGPAYLNDGLHTDGNSGYTVWTNVPPGTMTLDLLATAAVSRIRLLNYPVSEKAQQYKIEYLDAAAAWQTVADASAGAHRGWEDWNVGLISARYLRFTGITNTGYKFVRVGEWEVWGTRSLTTVPQLELNSTNVNVREGGEGRFYVRLDKQPGANVLVTVVRSAGDSGLTVLSGASMTFSPANYASWRRVTLQAAVDGNGINETATFTVSTPWSSTNVAATALDGEIGENLARTGGSTIMGTAGSYGRPKLIDGIHTDAANYGYTVSTNVPAATITLDLKANATLTRIRLLNFDWIKQENGYSLDGSTDNTNWTTLVDASAVSRSGWDEWVISDETVRYLRFTGEGNSLGSLVRIAELEVYGTRPGGRRSAGTTLAKVAGTLVKESEPISVLTSDGVEDGTGWAAVDGDSATAWVGQKAGGGHLLVEYAPALKLKALEVDLAEDSLAGIQYLYSPDAKNWKPLPDDMERNPVLLNFLWLVFPDDGTAAVPKVIEVRPNP